jgi:hypothetical protein
MKPLTDDAMRLFAKCSGCKRIRLMWVDPFAVEPQFCDECLAAVSRTVRQSENEPNRTSASRTERTP